MKSTKTSVTVVELQRLLIELRDKRKDICIRFRLIGEMWKPNFLRIVDFNGEGLIVNDEVTNRLMFFKNLSVIMQFEIDAKFQSYEPHFHYDVIPDTFV